MVIRATFLLWYSWSEFNRKRVNFILNKLHSGRLRCLDNLVTFMWSYSLQKEVI